MKKKATKKKIMKGSLFIFLGIVGILFYIILSFKEASLGTSGFFVILISIILIIKGLGIIRGKDFLSFNKGVGLLSSVVIIQIHQ